ncbi:hypothetical protein H7X65_02085 [Candidatus Parcubacteria bacterium]|nr:hypothetical protein [Candidatus Parcubacteria bacterium]
MKKVIQITVVILIIGGIAYYYLNQKVNPAVLAVDKPFATTTKVVLNETMFVAATSDPDAVVLATGDLNNDTYEDAIMAVAFCGASCSLSLEVVLNIENRSTKSLDNVSFDGYKSSSATKSDLKSVKIENGIITLVGKGLDCEEDCTEGKWNVEKTIQYKLEGAKIIRIGTPLTN